MFAVSMPTTLFLDKGCGFFISLLFGVAVSAALPQWISAPCAEICRWRDEERAASFFCPHTTVFSHANDIESCAEGEAEYPFAHVLEPRKRSPSPHLLEAHDYELDGDRHPLRISPCHQGTLSDP